MSLDGTADSFSSRKPNCGDGRESGSKHAERDRQLEDLLGHTIVKALTFAVMLVGCTSHSSARAPDTLRTSSVPYTARGSDSAAVVVRGPTLIAFFPRVSQAAVDSNADLSETLGDFSYHLSTALDSLRALGITVEQRPVDAIDIIEADERRRFVPAKDSSDVGYVFVAPGRHDRAYYGVTTNSDLIAKAREFLRSPDR